MKVFVAGLDTETNTFSPIPTGRQAFVDGYDDCEGDIPMRVREMAI